MRLVGSLGVVFGVVVMHGLMPSAPGGAHLDLVHVTTAHEHGAGDSASPSMAMSEESILLVSAPAVESGTDADHGMLPACLAVLSALGLAWLLHLALRRSIAGVLLERHQPHRLKPPSTGPPRRRSHLSLCVIRV